MKPVLHKLQSLLKRELSAKEIAEKMECSIPTAYRRIAALEEAGALISTRLTPRNKTGPVPTRYQLQGMCKHPSHRP